MNMTPYWFCVDLACEDDTTSSLKTSQGILGNLASLGCQYGLAKAGEVDKVDGSGIIEDGDDAQWPVCSPIWCTDGEWPLVGTGQVFVTNSACVAV